EQKKQVVAELAEKLKEAKSAVVVTYQGITVEDDTKLRTDLRKAEVEYKVYKNSIIARAMEEAGYGAIKDSLFGMCAVAFSAKDEVTPAKILKEYAEKVSTFELKAGFVDGGVIDAKAVEELASTPNKETLVCKVMGCMKSPVYGLAYALQAIIDKAEGTPAEAE
ncbi:MAG: 50S ribosomal protein L10, partial [Clostridia bacterium]|nr:50S ribosomal protein L10 [Clostridia bacterium]